MSLFGSIINLSFLSRILHSLNNISELNRLLYNLYNYRLIIKLNLILDKSIPMRISIALYLISIYCCICNEDNLEIQKESGLFRRSECARRFLHVNITNHHLEIREVLSNIKENI